jgi:D-methionine transport system ATP-binding protein
MDVVRNLCHQVAVLDQGSIVERGTVYDVFTSPQSETAKRFVSTIFGQKLPNSVQHAWKEQKSIYQIIFTGEIATQPLIAESIQKFQININILQGSITELQGKPFGDLLVSIENEANKVQEVIQYLQARNVVVKEVKAGGI